jgi:hypothetical protein
LRSGGSTAATAAGIDDRLFKKHGRWKSDTAKDGYVKENIDVQLLMLITTFLWPLYKKSDQNF